MHPLFALSLALASLVAGPAGAAGLFSRANSYSTAAASLNAVGLAILMLTALSSVGVLIAGVWVSLHRQPEGRMHRLQSHPSTR
jgi:hypothetical protein